jgi:hypothetical protein
MNQNHFGWKVVFSSKKVEFFDNIPSRNDFLYSLDFVLMRERGKTNENTKKENGIKKD